uniref:Uncharacterized protein n=1 Tax=Lactuca sativa TaxID=4236 RepID=A0A9R1VLR0_LACSA|nr:hypothetical protein LSAT_V11C400171710 [Lactuca sativa]
MDQIESNPGVPIRAIQEELQRKYEVSISGDKVFRAKALATKMVVGDYTKQYAVLRDYVVELQATNVDTTVKIQVESEPNCNNSTRQFKWMYVCLCDIPIFSARKDRFCLCFIKIRVPLVIKMFAEFVPSKT